MEIRAGEPQKSKTQKPVSSPWTWLTISCLHRSEELLGSSNQPPPLFFPRETHLSSLCHPKSLAIFKDSHGSWRTEVKLISLQQSPSSVTPGTSPDNVPVSPVPTPRAWHRADILVFAQKVVSAQDGGMAVEGRDENAAD